MNELKVMITWLEYTTDDRYLPWNPKKNPAEPFVMHVGYIVDAFADAESNHQVRL